MKELSVIMPAKNEEEHIFGSIKEVGKVFDNYGLNYEIVVVDDGSSDGTYREASKAAAENDCIKVFRKEYGGKGSALEYGFNKCSGRLVTFLDADLDLHPRQIPLFIEYLKRSNADVVIGSKVHPLSKVSYPLHRKILSRTYHAMVQILFDITLTDTQAGLKLFKREVLRDVLPSTSSKKYAFDLELLIKSHRRGFKIVEAPVELNWQRVKGRIGLADIVAIAFDTAAIFYRLNVS
jgi:glycosyltransferase involved in cell wall biosynthesis